MNDEADVDRDRQELHDAIEELGFDYAVEEELRALTASVEGGAFFALIVVIGGGLTRGWFEFCKALGSALADDAHEALKSIFGRRQVIIRDENLSAIVENDTPPEAVEDLARPPDAPSGVLYWDQKERRWKDALDR